MFLGGWQAPFAWLEWIPSWIWFAGKFAALIFSFIWVRATLPRLRLDQLLNFAWKILVPLALVNLVAAALWLKLPLSPLLRWPICGLLIVIPYFWLGRNWKDGKAQPRQYSYAE